MLKMSNKVEFEIARDKGGFLKCEDCQRRFITKIGFENHSCNQHKKEAETDPNDYLILYIPKQTKIHFEKGLQIWLCGLFLFASFYPF